jgi:hypothetical protein
MKIARSSWYDDAACRGMNPQLWIPSIDHTVEDREAAREGQRACFRLCPVREECLAEAVENNEPESVWGGLTPPQRVRWRKAKDAVDRLAVVDEVRSSLGLVPRQRA